MRLPRFRLRTLMIAVAVVAVALGVGAELQKRADRYRRLARFHWSQRREIYKFISLGIVANYDINGNELTPLDLRQDAWHERMAEKYLRASYRPWLPVEPDAPFSDGE